MVDVTVNDLCVVCSNIPLLLEAWCGGLTLQFFNYYSSASICTVFLQLILSIFEMGSLEQQEPLFLPELRPIVIVFALVGIFILQITWHQPTVLFCCS